MAYFEPQILATDPAAPRTSRLWAIWVWGVFSYFQCKIWRHFLAVSPRCHI